MATIIPESATFVKSMRLLKCQPILNHPKRLISIWSWSGGRWRWRPQALSLVELRP